MPSLESAIEVLAGLGLIANIEMKCEPGDAPATARVLAAVLDRHWPRDAPPLLVSSFDLDALAAFRDAAPVWPRGFLVPALTDGWRARFDALGCATLHIGARNLRPGMIAEARTAGVPVAVYTVNDPHRAARLYQWGADAIISDAPDVIAAIE